MHDYDFDDVMQSWYCGKNVSYDFCHHDPDDECLTQDRGEFGAGSARNPDIGDHNELTTLRLHKYDALS